MTPETQSPDPSTNDTEADPDAGPASTPDDGHNDDDQAEGDRGQVELDDAS